LRRVAGSAARSSSRLCSAVREDCAAAGDGCVFNKALVGCGFCGGSVCDFGWPGCCSGMEDEVSCGFEVRLKVVGDGAGGSSPAGAAAAAADDTTCASSAETSAGGNDPALAGVCACGGAPDSQGGPSAGLAASCLMPSLFRAGCG
jgi:hypothetical protein